MSAFIKRLSKICILVFVHLFSHGAASAEQTNQQKHVQEQVILKPVQLDKLGTLILIRTTLLALDQANKTGLYTVIRDLGSPAFQTNTAAKLSDVFSNLRRDKIDLSATAVLEPQLTLLPGIDPKGLLQMAGYFPSVNEQIYFELAFAPVEGQWRLFGISVRRAPAAPAAPTSPSTPASSQNITPDATTEKNK